VELTFKVRFYRLDTFFDFPRLAQEDQVLSTYVDFNKVPMTNNVGVRNIKEAKYRLVIRPAIYYRYHLTLLVMLSLAEAMAVSPREFYIV
jgi:hypothetical protein